MSKQRTKLSIQELVSQLERPRKMSTLRFKEPIIDRQEVRKNMRLKWKDPGYSSIEFSKAPILKPKILNEWELDRINMSLRSYKVPKNSRPYRFDSQSRPFPKVTPRMYSEKFQRYLRQVELQKEDLQFKDKRMITEGTSHFRDSKKVTFDVQCFRPVTTSTNMFGFTSTKFSSKKRFHNPHIKTSEV